MIKGKVQKREWPKDSVELEFKVGAINMLSDVKDDFIKSIQVSIPLQKITNEWYNEFAMMVNDSPGNISLKFNIYDSEEKINLNFHSRVKKIDLTPEFVKFLQHTDNIKYRVN